MSNNINELIYKCRCSDCIEQPNGEIALFHTSINLLVNTLDEKYRRQFAGLLASQFGYGGIQYLSIITGLDRDTISRGKREIEGTEVASKGGIRTPGGGRHKAEKKSRAC